MQCILIQLFLMGVRTCLMEFRCLDDPIGVYAALNNGKVIDSRNTHNCEICMLLLSNADYINKIMNLPSAFIKQILFRFNMVINFNNN